MLSSLDRSIGLTKRFAQCFTDFRDADLIDHPLLDLIRQRVYAIAHGYEDLNDHESFKADPLLATICGKKDPLGEDCYRKKDKGNPLAGKTLSTAWN